jgi:hypothetical protein
MKKKQIFNIALALVFLIFVVPLKAQVSKEKTIQENFSIQNGTTLSVDNKFGTIHINTANVSQIQVKVTLIAKAKNDDRAEKVLNSLNVEMTGGKDIRLETIQGSVNDIKGVLIPSMLGGNDKKNMTVDVKMNNNENFEVNYLITMPSNIPLNLENKFGSIYLGNHQAALDIDLSYGSLKGLKFTGGDQKTVSVKFGSANIDYLENANVEMSFSDLDIQEAKTIQYSGKHGSCEITKVHEITGTSSFSKFIIGTLTGRLQMESKQDGEFQINQISSGFSGINLDASFAQVSLGFDANTSFKFDVDVKFAGLKMNESLYNITDKQEGNTSAHYEGSRGTNPKALVKIYSKYGDVKFK